ncbi:MAG: hypothetical protein LBS17_04845 [Actinomycetes bacterium]|jgi:rubrerythrin|nr:hypothetical protein [Actinomycetes bacterium]
MAEGMPEVRVWRCLICGDSYIGVARPNRCPFCGSNESVIVAADCYPPDINDVEITDAERADLEHACELEITNAQLYNAMGRIGDRREMLPSAYRAFAKVEKEHLEVFCKLLKREPDGRQNELRDITDDWKANITLSNREEEGARDFYREAGNRATTARVRQCFLAIADVEEDHAEIDAQFLRLV